MKNIILFLSALSFFLISCSKDESVPINLDPIYSDKDKDAENIFKETGCFPKDVNSIRKLYLFVDSLKNDRYLFGSKEKDGKECFWASKYNSVGTVIWDRVYSERTYGILPKIIKNGNVVVTGVISG